MPPKTSKPKASRSRSKSTDKKPARSRSASRSRGRAKPKKFASETKRPRSSSRERSADASPVKVSSRSVASVAKSVSPAARAAPTPPSSKAKSSTSKTGLCAKLCGMMPCCSNWNHLCQYPGALFGTFALPFLVFYLNCLILTPATGGSAKTMFGQSVALANAFIPVEVHRYFDWKVSLLVLVSIVKSCLITRYLRVGKKVTLVLGGKRFEYCNNFWLVFLAFQLPIVVLFFRGDLLYSGFRVTRAILEALPAIYTTLMITLFLDSAYLFHHAGHKRTGSKTLGGKLLDFYHGREARPVVLGFDVKVLEKRIALCFMFSIALTYALAQYESKGHLEPGLALVFIATSIRVLDSIMFEHKSLSCYAIQHAGCGFKYMCEMKVLFPFMYTLFDALYFTHPELGKGAGSACNVWLMGMAAAMFLAGYCVFRAAENQKYAFKTDPHHPRFARMETVPTGSGKKLLAGGWWGVVRHPNYLGAQLMTFSMAVPMAMALPHMWLLPLFSLIKMVERIFEVEEHMGSKYAGAFAKYTSLVPKRLIPRIF